MNKDSRAPLHDSAQYVAGQVLALQAIVLALARLTTDRPTFRQEALQSIERLRTALLPEPVSDAQLAGVDQVEQLLQRLA